MLAMILTVPPQCLRVVADPFGEREAEVHTSTTGIVIGRINLPLVNEGAALFHIARREPGADPGAEAPLRTSAPKPVAPAPQWAVPPSQTPLIPFERSWEIVWTRKLWLAWKPICRKAGRFLSGLSIPKSRVSLMVVSVRQRPALLASRYLPDRRDLNRFFPGSEKGSLASRLAHVFLSEIAALCTHGLNLHTGAIHRDNLPQVRACTDDSETMRMARAFDAPVLINTALVDAGPWRAAGSRSWSTRPARPYASTRSLSGSAYTASCR